MIGLVRDNIPLSLPDLANNSTVNFGGARSPELRHPQAWARRRRSIHLAAVVVSARRDLSRPLAEHPASAGKRYCRTNHLFQHLLEWCVRW